MPTEELTKLLNKRKGKVEGDGATWESAPAKSSSDFASPVKRRTLTEDLSTSPTVQQEYKPRAKPFRRRKEAARGGDRADEDGTERRQPGNNDRLTTKIEKRKEKLEGKRDVKQPLSKEPRDKVDAPKQRRPPDADNVLNTSVHHGIAARLKDDDYSAPSLLRKRREEVDTAGEMWESAPTASSTDFVATIAHPPLPPETQNTIDGTSSFSLLGSGDHTGPELLRKRREEVDAAGESWESMPAPSTSDVAAPSRLADQKIEKAPKEDTPAANAAGTESKPDTNLHTTQAPNEHKTATEETEESKTAADPNESEAPKEDAKPTGESQAAVAPKEDKPAADAELAKEFQPAVEGGQSEAPKDDAKPAEEPQVAEAPKEEVDLAEEPRAADVPTEDNATVEEKSAQDSKLATEPQAVETATEEVKPAEEPKAAVLINDGKSATEAGSVEESKPAAEPMTIESEEMAQAAESPQAADTSKEDRITTQAPKEDTPAANAASTESKPDTNPHTTQAPKEDKTATEKTESKTAAGPNESEAPKEDAKPTEEPQAAHAPKEDKPAADAESAKELQPAVECGQSEAPNDEAKPAEEPQVAEAPKEEVDLAEEPRAANAPTEDNTTVEEKSTQDSKLATEPHAVETATDAIKTAEEPTAAELINDGKSATVAGTLEESKPATEPMTVESEEMAKVAESPQAADTPKEDRISTQASKEDKTSTKETEESKTAADPNESEPPKEDAKPTEEPHAADAPKEDKPAADAESAEELQRAVDGGQSEAPKDEAKPEEEPQVAEAPKEELDLAEEPRAADVPTEDNTTVEEKSTQDSKFSTEPHAVETASEEVTLAEEPKAAEITNDGKSATEAGSLEESNPATEPMTVESEEMAKVAESPQAVDTPKEDRISTQATQAEEDRTKRMVRVVEGLFEASGVNSVAAAGLAEAAMAIATTIPCTTGANPAIATVIQALKLKVHNVASGRAPSGLRASRKEPCSADCVCDGNDFSDAARAQQGILEECRGSNPEILTCERNLFPMSRPCDEFGAKSHVTNGTEQEVLTAARYEATRRLILQLRYSTTAKKQNLSSIGRFCPDGAYAQARDELVASLPNWRVRRPLSTVERRYVEADAGPSKPVPKPVLQCPTGNAKAWDTCLGTRLNIGTLHGAKRYISRICFGRLNAVNLAVATLDGAVLICNASELSVVLEVRVRPLFDASIQDISMADNVQALEFSPSDDLICLLHCGTLRLWRVQDGQCVLVAGTDMTALAFTPPTESNVALACGNDCGNVQLFDCQALMETGGGKSEREFVLVNEQPVSQYNRAITAMAFEVPWSRLFVADTFAKVHLLHRHNENYVVDAVVRFGHIVGIGNSPRRVVSMRHVWRSAEFGRSRGAVLCLCWDKVLRLVAVGVDDVGGVKNSELEFVNAFSLAGTAWAAWRLPDGSDSCAKDEVLRNVEIAFLSLDVDPVAAAAWRQPLGGIAAITVNRHGDLQFLGQLSPPREDIPNATSFPTGVECGGGFLATDGHGRSWASVAPGRNDVFLWRLNDSCVLEGNEGALAARTPSKRLSFLIRGGFPAVRQGALEFFNIAENSPTNSDDRKNSLEDALETSSKGESTRSTFECFDIAVDSPRSEEGRRYSLEDTLEEFLGSTEPSSSENAENGDGVSSSEHTREHENGGVDGAEAATRERRSSTISPVSREDVKAAASAKIQRLIEMGFTEADARRALLLDVMDAPEESSRKSSKRVPSPLVILQRGLQAIVGSPLHSPRHDVSPSSPSELTDAERQEFLQAMHRRDVQPAEDDAVAPGMVTGSVEEFIGGSDEETAPPVDATSQRLVVMPEATQKIVIRQLRTSCEDAIGEMWTCTNRQRTKLAALWLQ